MIVIKALSVPSLRAPPTLVVLKMTRKVVDDRDDNDLPLEAKESEAKLRIL